MRIGGYDPATEAGVEAVLAVGNGFAGVRGGLEEGPEQSIPRTFVAGLFNRLHPGPEPPATLAETPHLVTAPDWLAIEIVVDGEPLHIDRGHSIEQTRTLDLRGGLLHRRWRQRHPSGRITEVSVLRCAHLGDRRALLEQIVLRPENYSGRIVLQAILDGRVMRSRDNAPRLSVVTHGENSAAVLVGRAEPSGITLTMAQRTRLRDEPGGDCRYTQKRRASEIIDRWEWEAVQGRAYTLDRFVACFRAEADAPVAAAAKHVDQLCRRGVERLIEDHRERWAERWQDGDVVIEGDDDAQRAVRWALYQLNSAVDPTDARVSVGARGLTGLSYNGHVFWDTEIYMLPYFALTWPEAARTLLQYRHGTLPAARARAAALGYRGALYAWESALTGAETTPDETPGPDGRPVPIYTGRRAHHISADVAYGVHQYLLATGDEQFLLDAGAEIVLETARFWASRAERGVDGVYHIPGVMGPDEYHEHVDDDVYTNAMARFNLELGCAIEGELRRRHPERARDLAARIGLAAGEVASWREVADGLVIPRGPDGLLEQFPGYLRLDDPDLEQVRAAHPEAASATEALGRERVNHTQIIKQADVVLLCVLLEGRLGPIDPGRNFAYYERRCDHTSSLSPGTHCLLAARLGLQEAAKRYFERSAFLDLANEAARADSGVHLANCGALWQALVLGVAGLRLEAAGLRLDPHLLQGWTGLRLPLRWRGSRLEVTLSAAPARIQVRHLGGGGPVRLRIADEAGRTLRPGETVAVPLGRKIASGGGSGM